MPYCPECKYEYVEGTATCSDCNTNLVDRLPEEDEHIDTNIKWKKLYPPPGRVYTEMLKEVFEKNGIPCVIQPGNISWSTSFGTESSALGTSPFLLVPEERFEECEKLLAEIVGDENQGTR